MLTWPRPGGDFEDFEDIHKGHLRLARAIAPIVPLLITTESDAMSARIRDESLLTESECRIEVAACDDVWVRDHGPIGVQRGKDIRLNSFIFDGWGGKYPAARDNALVPTLAQRGALSEWGSVLPNAMTLEGGGIETDGEGTLLATRSSVLDPRRNPGMNQYSIEAVLRDTLGIKRFLWLDHGDLAGDDTDGHIDTVARFVSADHIVYQSSQSERLPNHASLSALESELKELRQTNGKPYQLSALPHTVNAHNGADGLLPTSYANFLMLNGHVLVPQYQDASDALALDVLRQACPKAKIIGVDCRALVRQYGSLHCATMNIPARLPR